MKIYGEHDEGTIKQMQALEKYPEIVDMVLCADGHKGYTVPIGGVVLVDGAVSPSMVGYDIACGVYAVKTDLPYDQETKEQMSEIMDEIYNTISFGVGLNNSEQVEHSIFDQPEWDLEAVAPLKDLARRQLGTVGSGNHFVDLLVDTDGMVWVATHFGSRGLGHKIATHYIKAGGGKDGMDAPPTFLYTSTLLGQEYLDAMKLAGKYAYAGRGWVVRKVVHDILGVNIVDEVHTHHNYAWEMGYDTYVHRKGATPANPKQRGFVGSSMAGMAAIVEGLDTLENSDSLYSTVHGSGRIMSRTQAAGKSKWINGKKTRVSPGLVSDEQTRQDALEFGVELRGGGPDESSFAYRKIEPVLAAHSGSVRVVEWLRPVGVAMAGQEVFDPYKD